ncbi:hypothetical protein LQG66_31500 [Bradyrhizobium ontarionense]|uniref:DUF2147 domain-containing protein n=1 Tax=Bradyrhizobium ontarionense TaxID=2898149 RepID=A0ABY3R9U1_9BRAD|nr:hypothetical protein [Bradyrhizobium sp. A19]UFZ03690.1 hypothetical protein LQG66_31500 [Bradyrhizobium sp. A19]
MTFGAAARLLIGGALILSVPLAVSEARADTRAALWGCWEQTSHAPLVMPSSGEEWGSRTWCFARKGKLISRTVACGSSGCDGWDNERSYRWRPPTLSFSELETSPDGKAQSRIWHRCRVQFLTEDWMQLQNCDQSPDPWVREQPKAGSRPAAIYE